MKKLILTMALVVASLFMLAGGEPCTLTPYTSFHDNGNQKMVAQLDCDGQYHGSFVEYNDDGSIRGYGHFDHGLKDGQWIVFNTFEEGTAFIIYYEDGSRVKAEKINMDLVDARGATAEDR